VNDDRQASPSGETYLLAKDLLLDVARRKVVVIVKADFAQGARQRLPIHDGVHCLRRRSGIGGELTRGVGVDADREPDRIPSGRHFPPLLNLPYIVCGKNHERVCHAGVSRALNDLAEVFGELGTG